MSTSELIACVVENFKLDQVELVDIDQYDILWGSDQYGIVWDIKTRNIELYIDGRQVGFLSKYNIENDLTDIDKYIYSELLKELSKSLKNNEEVIEEINKILEKFELFENYEEAIKIRDFLNEL